MVVVKSKWSFACKALGTELGDVAITESGPAPWEQSAMDNPGLSHPCLLAPLCCDKLTESGWASWLIPCVLMALTPKTASQMWSDLSVNYWLGLCSFQKDESWVRWISASRIHHGALPCLFTRWAPIGLRGLICFTACFVDCIWPDVPLCEFPKRCGREGTPWCQWNCSQKVLHPLAQGQPPPLLLSGSKIIFQTEGSEAMVLRPHLMFSVLSLDSCQWLLLLEILALVSELSLKKEFSYRYICAVLC